MCIFNNSENSRDCEHAECQIIKTIKKINKPIFKKPRSKTSSPEREGFFNALLPGLLGGRRKDDGSGGSQKRRTQI
jgi:hypothetical protein